MEIKESYLKNTFLFGFIFTLLVSCDRHDDYDKLAQATLSSKGEIFTDLPIGMGTNFYFPYGPDANNPVGSKLTD